MRPAVTRPSRFGLPSEDDSAGLGTEYADAVVDALGDRRDIVVVAELMGDFTAPIVCTRRPVQLLVLLNAMIPVPGETFNTWWSDTDSARARREYHASIGLEANCSKKATPSSTTTPPTVPPHGQRLGQTGRRAVGG